MSLGQFPNNFKRARITALHKSKSKLDPGNYRPVSILPILSKILERIVHTQLYRYLVNNNLLTDCQSGFRPKHNTVSSIIRFTDYCFEQINNQRYIGMVALDLRKAFDTVNHRILLKKLKHYGIIDKEHSWFTSYLTDRQQVAVINGIESDSNVINTGVPVSYTHLTLPTTSRV